MEAIEQQSDSTKQAYQDEGIYELKLYVVGNNIKSRLALNNLKKICSEYLEGKCHIEVIDLAENPSFARKDQIIAIPTLIKKNYPKRKIIGDLSNPEKVLEFLGLSISSLRDTVHEKDFVEKTSAEESKSRIVKSKRSKENDLQPYIGSNLDISVSKNLYKWGFSFSHSSY